MRRLTGSIGESLAARFLARNNFAIWKRNWRCDAGELDLIAIRDRCLHLIEVKTRTGRSAIYTPFDQITRRKEQTLQLLSGRIMTDFSLQLRRRRIRSVQIDLIGIEMFWTGIIPRYRLVWLPQAVPLSDADSFWRHDRHNSYLGNPTGIPRLTR